MTVRLEYSCTDAEMKEAQSLHLRQHYGGGSKWRARLVQFGLLALMLAGVGIRFVTEIKPNERPWFLALLGAVFVVVLVIMRLRRRKTDRLVQLEISERELVFTTSNGRTVMAWCMFGQCLESPALFVLMNRPKTVLWAVPKRAFPDEKEQEWFRTLANQPRSAAISENLVSERFAAKGITFTVQFGYRDHLTRVFTSWRMRGLCLGIIAFISGVCLYLSFFPQPDAMDPPGRVFLIMMATMIPMLIAILFLVAFIAWRSGKKSSGPQHVALASDGIQFSSSDGSGHLAWATYKYYLENRCAFFVWNPQSPVWMMFPKRAFASALEVEQCRDLLRTNLQSSRWFFF